MIEYHTLTDGGQTAAQVAELLAGFLAGAQRSLDIAIYDFSLSPATAAPVVAAIRDRARRGVAVRLLYDVEHGRPIPVPPPPGTERELIESLGVPSLAVPGVPDLMHHKYVVRDGASVWTGSMNWSDDSWTRQENLILVVRAEPLAAAYTRNFEELWAAGTVAGTGAFTPVAVDVDGARVRAWFCPGRGPQLAHRVAAAVGCATRRLRVCSPVLTSGSVLGALAEVAAEGHVDLSGVYDATQMAEVMGQWRAQGYSSWKIQAFRSLIAHAPFGGKRSVPYAPGSVHDYMHAKIVVADDTVFAGSFNFSHSGEANAENVLEIESPELADRLAAFIDDLRARYPAAGADQPPAGSFRGRPAAEG